ncbi:MAG: polysaccharide pyruvyl transferase family protein [Ruminococcus sp.]|nr:polysaccharide pyruvyl transferase family protein [Ruminococcus sp.]
MEKKKIGIISCFDMQNVNYGNRLQAYALNAYLQKNFPQYDTTSLYFGKLNDYLKTKNVSIIKRAMGKVKREYLKLTHKTGISSSVSERMKRFNAFSRKYIRMTDRPWTWEELINSDFDVMIIGSDIVWYQWNNKIRRSRFLDFKSQKNFKRIAYAASFGRDWIPEENIAEVKRCLENFQNISVREASSVEMLRGIGITNSCHTLDPTLLLDKSEWEQVMSPPERCKLPERFIFVYMLGGSKNDREQISAIASKEKLSIVTVPNASGNKPHIDDGFGDIRLDNCSPDEWIWLIANAEYVITDSFHGIAFATIFSTRFLVTKRKETFNINNRLFDYLKTIGQQDKMTDLQTVKGLSYFQWDMDAIHKRLEEKRIVSKQYLADALKD